MIQKQPLGAHFSIAGGLDNALYEGKALNCDTAQIFTKNARSWKDPQLTQAQIQTFKQVRRETGILRVFSHCTYLINIAALDEEKRKKSLAALEAELIRAGLLGLDGVVLHPGAHLGQGVEKGLAQALKSLDHVLSKSRGRFPRLLIETTAGSGTSLGSRFEEIGWLIRDLDHPGSVGVCLDTAHVFAAGYDIRTSQALDRTLGAFDARIGLSRLHLIHVNDSKPDLGSRKDRHEHIGDGRIGISGFRALMNDPRLAPIPKILETPKEMAGRSMDPVNLNRLRELAD